MLDSSHSQNPISVDSTSPARACGPVLLLICAEIAGLALVSIQMQLGISRFSASVSLLLILSGLIMPVVRPSSATRLAAILAVLLAGLLVIPFDIASINLNPPGPLLFSLPPHALLRYFNGTLAIPVGLHLASRFPVRSPAAVAAAPTDDQLLLIYGVSSLLTLGMLLIPRGWLRPVVGVPMIGWLLFMLALAHLQLLRVSRDPDPVWLRSAHQARLLLLGFLLGEAPLLLRLLLFGLGWPNAIPYDIALLFQVFVPLTVAYAILRHDLFEIDAAVRRALAYTGVTAVLLGVYFGLTDLLSRVLVRLLPQFQTAVILLALVAAALAFRPLYTLLQRFVDRLFYPERLRFAQVIADVRQRLQQVVTRRQVFGLLVDDLPVALDSQWANLVLSPAPDLPGNRDSAPAWNGRLEVRDRVLGRYWLGPRRSGLGFDAGEQAQLQAVVSQAALALAYAESVEALNELNQNLEEEVALQTAQVLEQQRALAVTEDRQRLARDLHDSVTQTLFSISLGSRALAKLVQQDPLAAAQGLAEQEISAQQALSEMRALLAQLRSPVLAEGDLVQALATHCAHLAGLGLAVQWEGPARVDVSNEVATELLYIAKEALHNVLKYAGVSQAECRLLSMESGLVLQVRDWGRGFRPEEAAETPGHGLGLHSMAARAARIGAVLTIDSAPGAGTTVTVHLSHTQSGSVGLGR